MSTKYKHGEAFALMIYSCVCGHREIMWNSRDGVTPFCLGCPSCGMPTLQHTDFRLDACTPKHKLHHGQRFWRDGTPDEAEAIMRRRLDMMKDSYPLSDNDATNLISDSRAGKISEFQKGWPMLDTHMRFK